MNLFDDLADICRREVPLAPLTWFRLGGPAEYLIEPRTEEQLALVLKRCRENGVLTRILGKGANVLVPDEGVRGAVIRLTGEAFTATDYSPSCVRAGAGVDLTYLVRHTVRRGLAGFEMLAGIPGTVGGGVCMNCGGRFGEIATLVRSVRVLGADGEIYDRDHDDLGFSYRRCALGGETILSVQFAVSETDPVELVKRFRQIWMFKQNSQPPVGVRSAGCIFRNPNGHSAGALIDQAGLKGTRIGGAYVSDRHANFILADSGACAADVRRLLELVRDRVADLHGVQLEPEVKLW